MEQQYFPYGQLECDYLSARDPLLGVAIQRIGKINRPVTPDLFLELMRSFVGQQISTKAQVTIMNRIQEALGTITPETVAAQSPEALQSLGLSWRKVGYMQGAAQGVLQGSLDLEALRTAEDEAVCKTLMDLPGIGRWTAEMLLIFALERPNILSYDDLGIRRGICMLHGLEALPRKDFPQYQARYAPYGTVASLYLWAISMGA